MCRTGGPRCPSSISALKGGTRPPSISSLSRFVRDTLQMGRPESTIRGRTRLVLMYPDVVVKIPLNDEGEISNRLEYRTYSDPEGIPVAPVKLVDVGTIQVAIMEHVIPHPKAFSDPSMPWWVSYVDCGQVGHLPDGRLVAYDL